MNKRMLVVLALCTVLGSAQAATLVVTNTTDGAIGSLRQRVQAAVSGDTILFTNTFSGTTITLTNQIVLNKNLIITATNLPAGITLNGGAGPNRIFTVSGGQTVVLDSLGLTGGDVVAGEYGGAIQNDGTLTMLACSVFSNSADAGGGGIFNNSASLVLSNCTLSANSAAGAAAYGGALYTVGGSVRMAHCTVASNAASASAGGVLVGLLAILDVENSIVAENSSPGYRDIATLFGAGVNRSGANIIQDAFYTDPPFGPTPLTNSPLLAALGNYGGRTRTMPPRVGSPAIDAAVGSSAALDQRGLARPSDGNLDGSTAADLGAVEKQMYSFVVTNATDVGLGTLRQGITGSVAVAFPDATAITFDTNLAGLTVVLTNDLVVNGSEVRVDASDLADGMRIDGGASTNRIFSVAVGRSLFLRDLTLTGGDGNGSFSTGNGGAIFNRGNLDLYGCTLMSNYARFGGGAIHSISGSVILTASTIADNRADSSGGGVFAESSGITSRFSSISGNRAGEGGGFLFFRGNGSFEASTLTMNSATQEFMQGGAIRSLFAPLVLSHCTVAANTSAYVQAGISSSTNLTISYCIIATNIALGFNFYQDLYSGATLTRIGTNIVQNYSATTETGSGTLVDADPVLGPLADNGGPTKTMAPLSGSFALDRGGGSTAVSDQRGFPRGRDGDGNGSGISDIGAFEAQTPPASGSEGLVVTTTADELDTPGVLGAGMSLREALRDRRPSGNIFFDTALFNGQASDAIVLGSGFGQLVLTNHYTISAAANTGGVVVDGGPGTNRVFLVNAGTTSTFQRLTVRGGVGSSDLSSRGGGIYNDGNLSLFDCYVVSNDAPGSVGGGILNEGILMLDRSTVAFNSAGLRGGGLNNFASAARVFATNSTFFGNTSGSDGGAVNNVNNSTSTFVHCTFSGNTATNAGGVFRISGTVNIQNSIIAQNIQPSGNQFGGTIVFSGVNITNGSPLATALRNNGGLTPTVALVTNSAAINAASGSTTTNDQRSLARLGVADVGAYERQLGVFTNSTLLEDVAGSNHFVAVAGSVLTATSSVPGLVQSLAITSVGSSYTLSIVPATNQNGSATITVSNSAAAESGSFLLTVTAVNDAPSFTKGPDVGRFVSSGLQTLAGWATAISAGPANESGQTLDFLVTNDSNTMFAVQPAIAPNGTLTFTPSSTPGAATVTVTLRDNGGNANGGISNSPPQQFLIRTFTTNDVIVSTTANSGPGSLRQAVTNAALLDGTDTITFAPGVDGQTNVMGAEIFISQNLTIDARSLSNGFTLSGGGLTRLFVVGSGSTSTLAGLTLMGGNTPADGGAIRSSGHLTLLRCTLYGNAATNGGGAISSPTGTLALTHCTLYSNRTAGIGGAVWKGGGGGATFSHCTIVENTANAVGGLELGVGPGSLSFSIVASNLPSNVGGPFTTNVSLIGVSPLLSVPGRYGGSTPTIRLEPGSPAINAATGSTATNDQRGFTMLGTPDIGAYERQLPDLAPAATNEDETLSAAFTVGPSVGTITATSDVPTLVASILFGSVDTNRTVIVTPAPNANGTATIYLSEDSAAGERASFVITFNPVNDAPSFLAGAHQFVVRDAPVQTVFGWALYASPGPDVESTQTVSFIVSNDRNDLFSVQPAVSPAGTLTFTPAAGTAGVAVVSISAQDDGAASPPNVNTSAVQTFRIYLGYAGIPNPSFELDTFVNFPGYIANNRPISGWYESDPNLVGQNPAGSSPFADNGTTPDGANVAFIQSFAGSASLKTTIAGLASGRTYRVSFRANIREATDWPLTEWSLNGGPLQEFAAYPPVSGANPYYAYSDAFIATGRTASLQVQGTHNLDASVLLDDFRIVGLLVVSNANDSGAGSLRQALLDGADTGIPHELTFTPNLSGAVIALASEIVVSGQFLLDVSSLPGGLTVSGNDATRIFQVAGGSALELRGLTFADGRTVGDPALGAAIFNHGGATVTAVRCTFRANEAIGNPPVIGFSGRSAYGGAVYNAGELRVIQSAFYSNRVVGTDGWPFMGFAPAGNGGLALGAGIYNDFSGSLVMEHVTFSANTANGGNGGDGISITGGSAGYAVGALFNIGAAVLSHVTISGNQGTPGLPGPGAPPGAASLGVGGIGAAAVITTRYSIITGNSDSNWVGVLNDTLSLTNGDALLAPLGNYGGPTLTMALLPGSPARNAATGSVATADQRGFAMVGAPDIGAYEAGTFSSFNAWVWETLLPTNADHAASADPDGDGVANENEWGALTDPGSGSNFLRALSIGGTNLTFPSVLNRTYWLQQADAVTGPWSNSVAAPIAGDGTVKSFAIPAVTTQQYFRVEVSP
jgi:hypothetical protein